MYSDADTDRECVEETAVLVVLSSHFAKSINQSSWRPDINVNITANCLAVTIASGPSEDNADETNFGAKSTSDWSKTTQSNTDEE